MVLILETRMKEKLELLPDDLAALRYAGFLGHIVFEVRTNEVGSIHGKVSVCTESCDPERTARDCAPGNRVYRLAPSRSKRSPRKYIRLV